jgi:tetratricopeptide (TPR) repeat protein
LVDAMSLELNERDRHRLSVTDTESPEALEEVIHARHDLSMFTYESSLAAEKRLRRAIAIDPGYARAYAELAAAFAIRMENDWIVLSHADTQKALYFADRALELDPGLWFAHYAMGRLHSVVPEGNIDTALHHLETAMELHPAEDDARVYYAILVMMSGRVDEARAILESVIASHPNAPFWYHLGLGNALFHLHEYEEALDVIARCLSQMPNSPYCLRTQMVVQARLGLASDAEWTIEEYALLGYDTSLEAVMKSAIERDPAMLAHLRESYELAGLE